MAQPGEGPILAPMKITMCFFLAAALLATLAACGNKGPLVHPQPPADEMAVPATTAAPADTTLPTPASSMPAAPTEPPPANGGG